MNNVRKVGPFRAAQLVLDDILADHNKTLACVTGAPNPDDFGLGNDIFHRVYGTLLEGPCNKLDADFREKVYGPLGFEVVAEKVEDFPSDAHMIACLGRLVRYGGSNRSAMLRTITLDQYIQCNLQPDGEIAPSLRMAVAGMITGDTHEEVRFVPQAIQGLYLAENISDQKPLYYVLIDDPT